DVIAVTADLQRRAAQRAIAERHRLAVLVELDALPRRDQRAGHDGATIGGDRLRHVAGDGLARVRGRLVRRRHARNADGRAVLVGPVALFLVGLLAVAPVEGADQVQAVIHQWQAAGQRDAVRAGVIA